MEENSKKSNGKIIVCIILIVLLIAALVGTFIYFNSKLKDANNNIEKTEAKLEEATGSERKAITANDFKKYIKTKGFNVHTLDEVTLDNSFREAINDAYLTEKSDEEDFRINFFELNDENNAIYYYYEAPINYSYTSDEINSYASLNYNRCSAVVENDYKIAARIGNTFIWGTINVENKEKLEKIFNDLGY